MVSLAGPKILEGQPSYGIASLNLSGRWVELVRAGEVVATAAIKTGDTVPLNVRYGVRVTSSQREDLLHFEHFVEEVKLDVGERESELVKNIKETLSGSSLKFKVSDVFASQLQLVRTLRPAPSFRRSVKSTSSPPAYDCMKDSFLTGPLRLELRPLAGCLFLEGMTTSWDVYHNISPADIRGHFLLLPSLAQKENWRAQSFVKSDCHDMVLLCHAIEPPGSLVLGFNSIGAGATQNHIHCHAAPPPAVESWVYPVTRARPVATFNLKKKVLVSYLDYPVFCIRLSSEVDLTLLARSLQSTLEALDEAPYNIGFLNQLTSESQRLSTDIFVFGRSREDSSVIQGIGMSEMMGLFHAQSNEEFELLTSDTMASALREVSLEDGAWMWESILNRLAKLAE